MRHEYEVLEDLLRVVGYLPRVVESLAQLIESPHILKSHAPGGRRTPESEEKEELGS